MDHSRVSTGGINCASFFQKLTRSPSRIEDNNVSTCHIQIYDIGACNFDNVSNLQGDLSPAHHILHSIERRFPIQTLQVYYEYSQ